MKEIKKPLRTKYFIAYTKSESVYHTGKIERNQVVSTGQDVLESFDTEIKMDKRLKELNG